MPKPTPPRHTTRRRPRLTTLHLLLLLLPPLSLSLSLLPTPTPPNPPVCLLIGRNPHSPTIQPNVRTLCLYPSICIPTTPPFTTIFSLTKTSPICHHSTTTFHHHPLPSCRTFIHNKIFCAHGPSPSTHNPICPNTTSPNINPSSIHWLPGLTLLIPEYPFPANIYHYATVLTQIAHIIQTLPKLHPTPISTLTILFKSRPNRNLWQRGLLHAITTQILPSLPYPVTIRYLRPPTLHPSHPPSPYTCFHTAILLGLRGSVNIHPFANDTEIPVDGSSVSAEAVAMKEAVYRTAGVSDLDMVPPRASRRLFRLPPLVVGYARRMGKGDLDAAQGGWNVRPGGTKRRFFARDEDWFLGVLREETGRVGMGLKVFTTLPNQAFVEQVRNIVQVGAVVGIHGANLMNGMFIRPFGALVELFPFRVDSPCYVAGCNSGLAYWRYTVSRAAAENGSAAVDGGKLCDKNYLQCRLTFRQRPVWLGEEHDRRRVRAVLREAFEYLKRLHQRFPGGVPVVLDEEKGLYVVDAT